jgi:hypothetical protein
MNGGQGCRITVGIGLASNPVEREERGWIAGGS